MVEFSASRASPKPGKRRKRRWRCGNPRDLGVVRHMEVEGCG